MLGIKIGIFEILVGSRNHTLEYSNFKSTSSAIKTKYKLNGSQTMTGFGLSFNVVE